MKAQASLAGRKTLIFFSSGLQVPPNLQDVFRTVVSEANRSNVSVYSVDARGLQTRGDISTSGAALQEAATTSMMQQMKAASDPTTIQEMQLTDTTLDSLTLNVQQTLSDLAEGTGGFLVANANDFGKAVDRLAADIHGYYEIQYAPAVVSFDGAFRRIAVKVARKDVVLQSRRGYFALPPSDQIILPYEMPLFMALSAPAPRHDFPHQAAALHFAPEPDGAETSVVVEVPLARGRLRRRQEEQDLRAAAHDARGGEGRRGARRRALQRRVPALRPPRPARGREAVERGAAAHGPPRRRPVHARDRLAGQEHGQDERRAHELRGAGRRQRPAAQQPLPPPEGGPAARRRPALGRPVPLRGHAPRPAPRRAGEPGGDAEPVLLRAPVPASRVETPKLTLDFVRDGKIVGRAQPPLPAPDASGRIAYVGGVPSGSFPPGAYEVRLTLTQGTARVTESTRFELAP